VFDNLVNSSSESIKRVEQIVKKTIPFIKGDIRHKKELQLVFDNYNIEGVIHFAGLKAVGESVEQPLAYYNNNVGGTITLCEVMNENNCKKMIFSSSATVYGDPHTTPIKEDFPLSVTNPYGRSKLIIEDILRDVYKSDNRWKIVLLRYFNPAGAHESGLIGEDPGGIPNNLMPVIARTAVGKIKELRIFGNDYNTDDGTGVRDYIHVVDLAEGHVKALDKLNEFFEIMTINLGTGKGYSVLEMIKAFEQASGRKVPYVIASRRAGDIAKCFADPSYAKEVLNWEAKRDIKAMCEDSWRWQLNNPDGFLSYKS
jgi:UDP-glucose 4-epimerase